MRKLLCWSLTALLLSACTSEEARTQITLMIDADPLLKSQLESVSVDFRSGPIGTPLADFVERPSQEFAAPLSWPLVVLLLPSGDDASRAFEIKIGGSDGAGVIVEASARSRFLKGKTLALRMRLLDLCRNSVFGSCGDNLTCVVNNGTASCADNEIDPTTLPKFVSVDPALDGGFDSGSDAQLPITREVTGRVFSTNGMSPLSGARVALLSGATAMTNGNGDFSITGEASDVTLTVDHPDHADVVKRLPDAASVYLEIFVKKVDVRQNVPAQIGGTVQDDKGTAATFPVSAFKRPNGTIETGMADVTLSAPDTKDVSQAQAFPGDFKATDTTGAGKEGSLSAFAAVDVTAKTGNEKLNIADGKEVEITLPTKEPNATATADLWSFDTAEQTWKKEGVATLTKDSAGRNVYRAKITHLSWWAVGTLVEDNTCVRLCATYNSAPAPYARATVSGIDQPFQGAFYADDTGCVAFDVPLSTQISVLVQSIDGVAPPSVFVTGGTIASSATPLSCGAVRTFTLVDRVTVNATCPSGLDTCGGTSCFDLGTDPFRCGACNAAACQTDQTCINGACTCNNSETLCSGQCTDLRSDPSNCGACGTMCPMGNRCEQGACVAAGCVSPTVSCDGICVNLAIDGVNGLCPQSFACTGALTDCGGVCVDLPNNPSHCGSCGNACVFPSGTGACMAGACFVTACIAGYADCDLIPNNGCEVSLGSDNNNCGACDTTCSGNQFCSGGMCTGGMCGDGIVTPPETCDDNNAISADGCSGSCVIEAGYTCPTPGSFCIPAMTCGSSVGTCRTGALMCQGGIAMCVGGVAATAEICDGQDNDCDTMVDNNVSGMGAPCGLSIGECVAGSLTCMAGAPVCVGGTGPTAEICDGRDNDCDGNYDESFTGAACGMTGGGCVAGMQVCQGGSIVCTGGVGPATEICDVVDNDCDGSVDEGFNLVSDPTSCGACGNVCNFPNAVGACMGGTCAIGGCRSGWIDVDAFPGNGCEYACTRTGSEVCNGIDDDCNGLTDEGLVPPPGFCLSLGVCNGTSPTCQSGSGWVCTYTGTYQSTEASCDSLDNDCDGLTDPAGLCGGTTAEACNNADDDSDSFIDEGLMRPCGANTGACNQGTQTCTSGVWGSCTGAVGPVAEICNGIDDNCDGLIDGIVRQCGVNQGECGFGTELCTAGAWAGSCIGGTSPMPEACDGLDNDCDGSSDEGNPQGGSACGSSTGECSVGTITCQAGALNCVGAISPATEVCDNLDNDCDGMIDDASVVPSPCGSDVGECSPGTMTCAAGQIECQGGTFPSAETCDSLDNDCDNFVDETLVGSACGSDVGECVSGTEVCATGMVVCQGQTVPASEISNGRDDDCDGIVDEGAISCP